jgi:hypothetical protein
VFHAGLHHPHPASPSKGGGEEGLDVWCKLDRSLPPQGEARWGSLPAPIYPAIPSPNLDTLTPIPNPKRRLGPAKLLGHGIVLTKTLPIYSLVMERCRLAGLS